MDSKKFGFRNFDYIIRFAIENESEIKKMKSRDRRYKGVEMLNFCQYELLHSAIPPLIISLCGEIDVGDKFILAFIQIVKLLCEKMN